MAQSIPTHYDNLKVKRNAPVNVIKASYRALAQKYHPDRNRAPDALSNMMLINQAWDVLGNPERRATHDRWIASQEQQLAGPPMATPSPAAGKPRARAGRPRRSEESGNATRTMSQRKHVVALCALAGVAMALLFSVVYLANLHSGADLEQDAAIPAPAIAEVPERTPHGYGWREPQDLSTAGPASFEIDNIGGKVDAQVRIYRDGRLTETVFVHHGRSVSIDHLKLGRYVIKYKIAIDGEERAFQSKDTFALVQTADEARENRYNKFNKIRVTKFNLGGGKLTADEIGLDQF